VQERLLVTVVCCLASTERRYEAAFGRRSVLLVAEQCGSRLLSERYGHQVFQPTLHRRLSSVHRSDETTTWRVELLLPRWCRDSESRRSPSEVRPPWARRGKARRNGTSQEVRRGWTVSGSRLCDHLDRPLRVNPQLRSTTMAFTHRQGCRDLRDHVELRALPCLMEMTPPYLG
jgi:hypothetical protein